MFFYVLVFLFGIASSKWKIKFVNETYKLVLMPGEFYPIVIKLESDSTTPYKAITNLTLEGEPVKTSEPYYELNSFLKTDYTIYIGVPCLTSVNKFQLNFTIDNTKDIAPIIRTATNKFTSKKANVTPTANASIEVATAMTNMVFTDRSAS